MTAAGTLPMRDYQREGVAAVIADWRAGLRRVAVVWPTGAGKTVGFAHLGAWAVARGGRVLVLAHRDELIEQAVRKFRAVAPSVPVGVVKGARRELAGRRVVVASVQSTQTAAARRQLASWRPTVVVVDECHHATARTYRELLEALGCMEPDGSDGGALAVGFTATLARGDGVSLGEIWQKVSHRVQIVDMIRRGFLLNVTALRVHVEGLDLRDVRRSRGDYQDGDLGEAMMQCLAPEAIARAYRKHAEGRRGIAFLPTVQTAYATADALNAEGIPAAGFDGTMPIDERRRLLELSEKGEIHVLCNCNLFTEGTDLPWVDVGVMGRPTTSAPLFVQMAGRILRPYPGQELALLMDVVGVGARHRLATLATLDGRERIAKLADELSDDELEALTLLGMAELPDEDERVAGAGSAPPKLYDGKLGSYEFSLFEESHRRWLQTNRGVWFIEAGTTEPTIVFLVPTGEPGTYSVAAVPVDKAGGRWVVEGVDMGYAMTWGEREAVALGGYHAKSASWRREYGSEKQANYLRSWGGSPAPGMTRGELSDAISVAKASARIDALPMLAGVAR